MKKLLIIIPFFSFYFVASQNLVVSADRNNELYIGVDNPISVAVENYPSTQIIVKTDHGTIEGSGGKYIYRGTEPGGIHITIYKKSNLKEIGSWSFRLKYIPDPVAKVGPYGNGNAIAAVLKSQQFIRAEIQNLDINASFRVDSFTLNVFYRDSCLVKEVLNAGNKFNDEISEALKKIKEGDIVLFKKIYIMDPPEKED